MTPDPYQKIFDPTDPFQGTIEDLRKTLSLAMVGFIQCHSTYRELDETKQLEVVTIGSTVAVMGVLSALVTEESRPHLVGVVADYIPDAFRMAQDIILNAEQIDAGGVQ